MGGGFFCQFAVYLLLQFISFYATDATVFFQTIVFRFTEIATIIRKTTLSDFHTEDILNQCNLR